ncbi:dienelactone hydrolase family protein [Tribonema minus]|uniref:Dienelactone hydrolase family protein n=1 Tax=Tribonema minus TaxID=303371 RepID=A0A836CLU0_9STRA|nr:dienelactone hydrolase family protein [Tribonema minus]
MIDKCWPQLTGLRTSASAEAAAILNNRWSQFELERLFDLQRQIVPYIDHTGLPLQGFVVRPAAQAAESLPCVLVAHTAVGIQDDLLLQILDGVAGLGYVAFGLDMFGAGQAVWDREQSLAARAPLTSDRSLLARRAEAALHCATQLRGVDARRVAVVGYCFGGIVALDTVRAGCGIAAAITFHGILAPPPPDQDLSWCKHYSTGCRVLVLHGGADPFVPPDQVRAFEAEMAAAGVQQCSVIVYDGARHAFTRPEKVLDSDRSAGLFYDAAAAEAGWAAMRGCLEQAFEQPR